jgi:spore germination cell wall hydrolase CwlJ-like protein
MSIIRRALTALVAVSALTVLTPGHAETPAQVGQQPTATQQFLKNTTGQVVDRLDTIFEVVTKPFITFNVSTRDEDCLARNIYYEAGSEPEEGKAAVGIVTINRVKDGRFAKTICDVVNQRTITVQQKELVKTEMVKPNFFSLPEPVTRKEIVTHTVPVCQFSWTCSLVSRPKITDPRWEESQRVARALLNGEFVQWIVKYENAIYFHAISVRPVWAKQKQNLGQVGGHYFYADSRI